MLVMTALMGTLAVPAMAVETTTNTAGQLNSLEAAEAGYLGAINRYRDARDMGYSEASIYGNDVNYILERAQPPALYYTLVDLAQDGVPELFIGYSDFMGVQVNISGWREGDYEFYDIFGYENGYVMRLFPTGMGIDERFHLMNGGGTYEHHNRWCGYSGRLLHLRGQQCHTVFKQICRIRWALWRLLLPWQWQLQRHQQKANYCRTMESNDSQLRLYP